MSHFSQLLEATARAVQPVLKWGESGLAVADGLSNLLKVYVLHEQFLPAFSYKDELLV